MMSRPILPLLLAMFALAPFAHHARAQQAPMLCANEFLPLREAVEREASAVKALADRKAPREQICSQLKKFAATEAKYLKYLTDNQSWCGVPPEAIKQVKATHNQTLKLRTHVCEGGGTVGGAPAGPPPGPGLSEALGTAQSFAPASPKTARGTYDTLTGNPFQR